MHSLTSALDGGEWSASHPSSFTSRERTSSTHWTGGWAGPRNGLDTASKRKIPSPHQELNPNRPIVQPIDAFMAWCSVKKKAQGQIYLYLKSCTPL
jgi:hypothetical protein